MNTEEQSAFDPEEPKNLNDSEQLKENEAPHPPKDKPEESTASASHLIDVSPLQACANKIKSNIAQVLIGQDEMVELMLVGLFTDGHILLEGLPGIAKTLTAKLLSRSFSASFSRIQFTPDLMPTDITGTSIFSMKDSEFIFKKGPVFAQIVLIDEINRAPAKTQAALIEVMEERQITYDGITYPMASPFMVIATQNPIEQEGTYALPEAQLDRFLFRIKVGYPSIDEEIQILQAFESSYLKGKVADVEPVMAFDEINDMRKLVEQVHIQQELLEYIAKMVHSTRNNGDLFIGASPRASLSIMRASKALAAIRGRAFVTPDDIKDVSIPVLNHRLILSHEREMEGTTIEEVIRGIAEEIEIPR